MSTRRIQVSLTLPQARGLIALAGQGQATAHDDRAWARAYLGAPATEGAANRGAQAIQVALLATRARRRKRPRK